MEYTSCEDAERLNAAKHFAKSTHSTTFAVFFGNYLDIIHFCTG